MARWKRDEEGYLVMQEDSSQVTSDIRTIRNLILLHYALILLSLLGWFWFLFIRL